MGVIKRTEKTYIYSSSALIIHNLSKSSVAHELEYLIFRENLFIPNLSMSQKKSLTCFSVQHCSLYNLYDVIFLFKYSVHLFKYVVHLSKYVRHIYKYSSHFLFPESFLLSYLSHVFPHIIHVIFVFFYIYI
jgi:hypothetical protein